MKLVQASIRFPVSVIVAVLLALLFGLIALARIPIQMIPTLDKPEITVSTLYPGAGPLEVEKEITNRQEEFLNTVENLRELQSTSGDGSSRILLKYDWGTNKDIARIDVSEKLAAVRNIPEDAEESTIRAVNSDQQTPIGWIVLQADEGLNVVRPLAWDVIKAQLERVEGVGQVLFFGGEEREIHVELDFAALAARGLSVSDVRAALREENRNVKAGAFDEGKRRFAVRTEGRYQRIEEVEETIIRRDKSGPVRVRHVAQVRVGYEEPRYIIRSNGEPAIIMGVLRKTGSNALEVMRGVNATLERLSRQYASRGIRLRLVYDASTYINEAIRLVTTSLLIGAILATGVLLFFLRSRSAVLVLGLAIPIVLLSTFIFLAAFGRTINIISLAGMAFVTGMILDSAIVVVENIFRHRELGKGAMRAAYDGANEVWGAVLASTLTTLAVFLAIILVEDEAGEIFRDIAIVISIAVGLSLIVAITVIPMLSARLLQTPPRTLDREGRSFAQTLSENLVSLLRWILETPQRKLAVSGGIMLGAVLIGWGLLPPTDYLPQGNRNLIYVVLNTPPGYNLKQSERIVRLMEERVLAQPEVARMFTVVRHTNPNLGIILKPEYKGKRSIRAFMKRVRELTRDVAGVRKVFIRQVPLIRRGRIGAGEVEVRIQGDDLEVIQQVSETLEPQLEELAGVEFVNPSFEIGRPEFVVDVDRLRASELGLSVSEIGFVVETMVNGSLVGTYDDEGREIDLRLHGPAGAITSPETLARTILYTPTGQTVQLADVARIEARKSPTPIDHTDMDRTVKLSVGVEVALSRAIRGIERLVEPVRSKLPLGYAIELGGQADAFSRTMNAFIPSLLLALLITYLLLASLFESFTLPAVILTSVPFAATGGIIALRILHMIDYTVKLDVITMLGFVILIGVVVNNAILLVHQSLNRLAEGASPIEAILSGVSTRVRPIFMTMTTTVFGMSPLVFAQGSGSELYRGLGAILIGGLILSTLFTLILIPTLLSFVLRAVDTVDERSVVSATPSR